LKGPKPTSKSKTQVKVCLDFQGGGCYINRSLPVFIQRLENPSLEEKEPEDYIHRDCTQFKSIEFHKNSIFVICDYRVYWEWWRWGWWWNMVEVIILVLMLLSAGTR